MNTKLDPLSEFDADIVASNSLPYAQIQNPPNLSLAQIEQLNPPWGWFIANEQAELAQFNPDDSFVPIRLTFGEKDTRSVDGFLTKKVRLSILHRSNIEVQSKTDKGWRYAGLAYKSGTITQLGEQTTSDRNNYRLRTRYLILFLGTDNQPLHPIPFRIGMNAGVGAAFGDETRLFRNEVEKVFFQLRKLPVKSLSNSAHALFALSMSFGLHKSEGKAPFIYPQQRIAPAAESSKTIATVERRGRQVELVPSNLRKLIIPKSSEAGKLILSLSEEHQGFADKFQDDLADDADEPDTSPFEESLEEVVF
ncbi:DUF5895 domain-containing protein [Myxosarcina sp. GI1]|uniref:DUF5895 domain-containing protein n=1 Tax=Myxosarcina sp. GI1 TaxID=1541065 RepID=UPI000691CBCD|nr:DUF5895 domain-containing protein [Myxosarcina sp. GI1]